MRRKKITAKDIKKKFLSQFWGTKTKDVKLQADSVIEINRSFSKEIKGKKQ